MNSPCACDPLITNSRLEVVQNSGNNSLPPKQTSGQPSTSAFKFQAILLSSDNIEKIELKLKYFTKIIEK